MLLWAILLIYWSLPQEKIAKVKTWFKADEGRLIETAVLVRKMDQRGAKPQETRSQQVLSRTLLITKTASAKIIVPGQRVTYTLSFSNSGAETATGVIITDIMSLNLTNPSVVSSLGGTQISPAYEWQVQDLAPNCFVR